MRADNIFHLVHHFGAEEDQVSANFAFMLSQTPQALGAFLEACGLPSDSKGVEVRVQVPYEDRTAKIDIEIRREREFLLFLESKIRGRPLDAQQLSKYGRILEGQKRKHGLKVRLVAVTQTDQGSRFDRLTKEIPLDLEEVSYFRWEDLHEMLRKEGIVGWRKELMKMFSAYMGEMMRNKVDVEDLKVGELEEVLVQATNAEYWEVNRQFGFCTGTVEHKDGRRSKVPSDALFVAFYRTKPESAITHIARVKSIERYANSGDVYKDTPMERMQREYDAKVKVYRFEPPVKLPRKIPRGEAVAVQDFRYTTIAKLLDAETLADL